MYSILRLKYSKPSKIALLESLRNDLVSYWTLDEFSDGSAPVTRRDSVGTNHLTDNNTVASALGMHNNAASFVAASNEYLSVASPGFVPATGSWTVGGWWNFDPALQPGATAFMSHGTNWFFAKYNAQGLHVQAWNFEGGDGTQLSNIVGGAITIANAGWHLLIFGYDADANKVFASVDGGAIVLGTGTFATAFAAQQTEFGHSVQSASFFTGQADELGLWSRVLTPSERAKLYYLGVGKFYPFQL